MSANGKPNRKRTWVAPTVPSLAVSSRCVALRTVCAAAAMTVNRAHNQPLSGILESLAKRTASTPYHSIPRKRYSEWPPFRRAGKRDMIWIGLRHGTKARMSESRRIGFIGLGHMGTPMAANLVRGGHDLLGYDIA